MSVIAKFLAGSKSVRHVSHSYAYGCIRTYGRKTHCAYECDGIQIQKKRKQKEMCAGLSYGESDRQTVGQACCHGIVRAIHMRRAAKIVDMLSGVDCRQNTDV